MEEVLPLVLGEAPAGREPAAPCAANAGVHPAEEDETGAADEPTVTEEVEARRR